MKNDFNIKICCSVLIAQKCLCKTHFNTKWPCHTLLATDIMALAFPNGSKSRMLYHLRPETVYLNWGAVIYTKLPPKLQNNILCCQRIAGVWCHGIGIPQWLTGTKHAICLMNMNEGMDYGRPARKSPSLHGRKSNPNPKFIGTAEAYFVCQIGPKFQISLIYAFIGCP